MEQQIYWHTTVKMPDEVNLLPLPERVDVAVIGGGYTGLSAARILAKKGAQTAVLETHAIGWGASSRNGGMALTGLKSPMQSVIKKHGKVLARRLFQFSIDSVDAVEQLVYEEKIRCGFSRCGHLLTANKPAHYQDLKEEVDFMAREFDHKVRLVSRNELKNEIGSSVYHGGLIDELSAGLNPAQYVAGLAKAAENAGALLCTGAQVTGIGRGERRYIIHTARGQVQAENILVATSGYTGSATRNLRSRIIPVGSFIIATERLPDDLAREISPRNRMIFDYKHYLNYFRLWDNRMIFGGRAAFFPETHKTIARSAEILRKEMVNVFPQLKQVKVDYAWGGTLDFAFDMMTHVGEKDGLHYSLGYAGHGVAMATILGRTVAEAMLAGNIQQHPFAQFDFPAAPFGLYNGFPWFLPLAGLWYKILDWVE